jgi:hypothetical protein
MSSLLGAPVIGPSPTWHATAFLQSVPGESESIHSRTLGWWRIGSWCCRVCSFWFGFDVSVAAIRRSPNTSLPGWRSRGSKRCDTRSQRHSHRSERRNASSAEAARRVLMGCHDPLAGSGGAVHWIGGVWFGVNRGTPAGMSRCSRLCPGWTGGLRGCRGVVTSGAKRSGTGADALRRVMHVGGSRDVGAAGETG